MSQKQQEQPEKQQEFGAQNPSTANCGMDEQNCVWRECRNCEIKFLTSADDDPLYCSGKICDTIKMCP